MSEHVFFYLFTAHSICHNLNLTPDLYPLYVILVECLARCTIFDMISWHSLIKFCNLCISLVAESEARSRPILALFGVTRALYPYDDYEYFSLAKNQHLTVLRVMEAFYFYDGVLPGPYGDCFLEDLHYV